MEAVPRLWCDEAAPRLWFCLPRCQFVSRWQTLTESSETAYVYMESAQDLSASLHSLLWNYTTLQIYRIIITIIITVNILKTISMCIGVMPTCVSVSRLCAWFHWWPKEGTESSETIVRHSCELSCWCCESNQWPARVASALNHWPCP